jgi:hypothetical protein
LSKGFKQELKHSTVIHAEGVPVLISSKLLRKNGCGQVDLAVFKQGALHLFEVKSNSVSAANLHHRQKMRLLNSARLLSSYLDCNSFINTINAGHI